MVPSFRLHCLDISEIQHFLFAGWPLSFSVNCMSFFWPIFYIVFSLLIFKSSVHFLAIYPFSIIYSTNIIFKSVFCLLCLWYLLSHKSPCNFFFFFFLVLPPVMWDLSSPNGDQPSPTAVEAQKLRV